MNERNDPPWNTADPRLQQCMYDTLAAVIDTPSLFASLDDGNGKIGAAAIALFTEHVRACVRCQWVRERVKMEKIPELDANGSIAEISQERL